MTSKLTTSFKLGSIELQNRIVMAPMTRNRADVDGVPTEIMAKYYGARAAAGLLITEGTAPAPDGKGYPRIPGLYNVEQVAGWKGVTRAVHEAGGHIFVQLMHTGRIGHQANLPAGARVVGASAIAAQGEMYTDEQGPQPHPVPHELTVDEVRGTIAAYATAAGNAIEAGFDGIELHGANGYLIDQFLNPGSNQRTDEYGGSIANRARFALEAARAAADAIGPERVGIRLSPYGVFNDLALYDEMEEAFTYFARELGKLGLAYLHIVDHSSQGAHPVGHDLKAKMRAAFGGAVVLSGGYDKERANGDLEADRGDLVSFGRPFIANPDLVRRFETDAELAEPDMATFYTPGEKGYLDYPSLT